MKFFLTIFLAVVTLTVSAQWNFDATKISADAKTIISKIQNDEPVSYDTMGLSFGYTKDCPLDLLREKLTIVELSELTNHNNPIVRCYCFKALTQRNEKVAFQVMANHLQDTIRIQTHHGCFLNKEFVGDYFIGVFQGCEAVAHDTTHLNILDSLLIFTPNKLAGRNDAIRTAGKKGKYYNRIKEIAVNDKLAGAVIALAGFKRPENANIIMHTKVIGKPFEYYPLATTFFAISQFPYPTFLPFLESHLQSVMNQHPDVESSYLYEAIASYNTKEAGILLARAFQIPENELRLQHLEKLSYVLTKNANPLYDDLRKKLAAEKD